MAEVRIDKSGADKSGGSWRRSGIKLAGIVIALAIWQAYAMASGNRLVPGLPAIGERLLEWLQDGEFWEHAASTVSHGLLGMAIGFVLAAVTGYLAARHWAADAAWHPIVNLLYPVPKLALYPIVILVLGLDWPSRVAQVALECYFPLFVHCHAGVRAVGPRLQWLARNAGASAWAQGRDIVWPSALPFLLTGLRVATPIMLIVTTVTEFIGDSQGLGHLIARSAAYFDTAAGLAVVIVLGAIGFIADRLLVFLRQQLVFWEKGPAL